MQLAVTNHRIHFVKIVWQTRDTGEYLGSTEFPFDSTEQAEAELEEVRKGRVEMCTQGENEYHFYRSRNIEEFLFIESRDSFA